MREYATTNLEETLGHEKLKQVILAFRNLFLADPTEKHFSINFCNFNDGRGQEVWCIIDEYSEEEGGLTATYLLPKDY